MANVKKYTLLSVGHMFNHYGRREGEIVKRSNENINPELTKLNYNLAAVRTDEHGRELSQMEILEKRLSEISHLDLKKRSDINVMADWLVTLPAKVPPERSSEFFLKTYLYLAEMYGEENVISAWVHMDETTPHLHFSFVPVVKDIDEETGEILQERLCAKERITRNDLQQFHGKLQEHLEQEMQTEVAILNGATAGGNLTIIELKMRDALKELAETKANSAGLKEAMNIVPEVTEMMKQVGELYAELDKALKSKKWFGDDDKKKMQEVTNHLDGLKEAVAKASGTATLVMEKLQGMDGKISADLNSVYKNLQAMQAKAERRIKREDNKVRRALERAEKKEQNIDFEIQRGVDKELAKQKNTIQKNDDIIKEQEEKIAQQKQVIADLGTDFWVSQRFLIAGHEHQEDFANEVQEWRTENENQTGKSIVPKG